MEETEVLRWNREGCVYVLRSDGRVLKRLHSSARGFEVVEHVSAVDMVMLVAGVLRNPDCVVVS